MNTFSRTALFVLLASAIFLCNNPAKKVFAQATDAAPAATSDTESTSGETSPAAEDDSTEASKKTPAAPAAPAPGAAKGGNTTWESIKILLVLAGLFIIPIIIGNALANSFKMPDHGWKISLIIGTLAAAALLLYSGKLRGGPDLVGGFNLVYEIEDQTLLEKDKETPTSRGGNLMDQMVNAIMMRINPGGQKEVIVRKFGNNQIEIIVPDAGDDEKEQMMKEITTLGELEFRITANPAWPQDIPIIEAAKKLSPYQTEVEVNGQKARWVPYKVSEFGEVGKTRRLVTRWGKKAHTDVDVPQALVLLDKYNVTGGYMSSVSAGNDQTTGEPIVRFNFKARGAQLFGGLTGSNLPNRATGQKRQLGIILNRTLQSAPNIKSQITDRGEISGGFTKKEVESLVNVLNAGSLPAALNTTPIRASTISPLIGATTIEKGTFAIKAALVCVFVFMALYYRFSGLVACFALAANLLLMIGIMVGIKAAFTLPGLAGLVLTVGMSVDANVLIFERIREELARGAALRMAIRNGFNRATRTIVDANLTTLITGVVLFWIGTDQIKGFAVTLILGILMSMFTAIFCSRVIFEIAEKQKWITKLSMSSIVGKTNFDFLGKRIAASTLSLVIIAIGLVAVVGRGKNLLNIDFTGGASVTMVLKEKSTQKEVFNKLAETDLGKRNLTVIERGETGKQFTINARYEEDTKKEASKSAETSIDKVEAIIQKTFGSNLETYNVQLSDFQTIPLAINSTGEENDVVMLPYSESPSPELQIAFQGDASEADSTEGDSSEGDVADSETASSDAESTTEPTTEQPATEPTTEPATEPATTTEGEPAANPGPEMPTIATGSAGTGTNVYAGGVATTLDFGEKKVSFDVISKRLEKLFNDAFPGKEIPFSLTNKDYRDGSSQRFSKWNLKVALPEAEAKPILEAFQKEMNSSPVFPLSNRIGGSVAAKMQGLATAAILISLVCIIGYIWVRFQHVVYGLAAVVALLHDVLITLGMLAISAYVVQFIPPLAAILKLESFQISLPIVAAFLTIIGYSLNDTIVVFDRVREVRGKSPILREDMLNTSINSTLSRTLLTSLTTLIVVVILYFFGGAGIHAFAFALVVGVIVGTYSSIFIASPALLWMSTPRTQPGTNPTNGGKQKQ